MEMTRDSVDTYLLEGCGRCKFGGTPECKVHKWPGELRELRRIVLACGLNEEVKWGVPVYTHNGANVCTVSAFKDYACLSFFKGSLLADTQKILDKPGENSQSARIIKVTSSTQVLEMEEDLRAYLFEAIEVENQGLKVDFKAREELVYPEELLAFFKERPDFEEAFEALTPGRQRGFILHFTQPKKSETRSSRIEKCMPLVFEGKGLQGK